MPNSLTIDDARKLDAADPLAQMRKRFCMPGGDSEEVYFVGNSLGLMPKAATEYVQRELEQWQQLGVRGHFEGDFPWVAYHEFLTPTMAEIVGGRQSEVVVMNGLTVNLHLMMATFFQPRDRRRKILIEKHSFPSDSHAVRSRLELSGLNADEDSIVLEPDDGELFTTDHVCGVIESHADELFMVMLPGVQYYTGQVFDMKRIAEVAHANEIVVGFDLAHAVGNVELQLHDWNVDFAVWCTYKYLNSGPGSVAGCFVHERHASNKQLPRMAGWWGHDKSTRFQMEPQFDPIPTAEGWQLSNPPILSMAAVRASLDLFKEVGGMKPLREKSMKLTRFFYDLLEERLTEKVNVITPLSPEARGCQLSLEILGGNGRAIYEQLESRGMRTDWREPNVIRAAPVPLYNSFEDVWRFVDALAEIV